MKLRMHFAAHLLAALLVVGPMIPPVGADSVALRVEATVKPYLQFSADQFIDSYRVTDADLRVGYVDLPGALSLQYQTNISEPIRFEIAASGPGQILVDGQAGSVQIAEAQPGQRVRRDLDLRILLPAQMTSGIYPLRVDLAPMAY